MVMYQPDLTDINRIFSFFVSNHKVLLRDEFIFFEALIRRWHGMPNSWDSCASRFFMAASYPINCWMNRCQCFFVTEEPVLLSVFLGSGYKYLGKEQLQQASAVVQSSISYLHGRTYGLRL
jgi:hypothetical protein